MKEVGSKAEKHYTSVVCQGAANVTTHLPSCQQPYQDIVCSI